MKLNWRGALGIALSAALLWWTLHDEHLDRVWAVLASSNIALFALATAAGTSTFALRAARWRPILEPVAGRVAFGPLWRATTVGMMVNNVVPLRAGELARAYALTREVRRVTLPAAVASLGVDRLFDAVVVLLLMFAALLDPAFPVGARVAGQPVALVARSGVVAVTALLIILYGIVFFPDRLGAAYGRVAGRLSPRLDERGRAALGNFAAGLGALRHPGRFTSVFAWTLAHWLVQALAFWLGFKAAGIGVPYSAALFLQGLIAMAVAVPSSPGFFGVFEGAATVGLAIYGVDRTLAIGWAIGYHILTFIPITVIGAYYFVRLGIHLRDVRGAAGPPLEHGSPDERRAEDTSGAADVAPSARV